MNRRASILAALLLISAFSPQLSAFAATVTGSLVNIVGSAVNPKVIFTPLPAQNYLSGTNVLLRYAKQVNVTNGWFSTSLAAGWYRVDYTAPNAPINYCEVPDSTNTYDLTTIITNLPSVTAIGETHVFKTKVHAGDATAGYLYSKLIAGDNVTFTLATNSGDVTLEIASTGGGGGTSGFTNGVVELSDTGYPGSYVYLRHAPVGYEWGDTFEIAMQATNTSTAGGLYIDDTAVYLSVTSGGSGPSLQINTNNFVFEGAPVYGNIGETTNSAGNPPVFDFPFLLGDSQAGFTNAFGFTLIGADGNSQPIMQGNDNGDPDQNLVGTIGFSANGVPTITGGLVVDGVTFSQVTTNGFITAAQGTNIASVQAQNATNGASIRAITAQQTNLLHAEVISGTLPVSVLSARLQSLDTNNAAMLTNVQPSGIPFGGTNQVIASAGTNNAWKGDVGLTNLTAQSLALWSGTNRITESGSAINQFVITNGTGTLPGSLTVNGNHFVGTSGGNEVRLTAGNVDVMQAAGRQVEVGPGTMTTRSNWSFSMSGSGVDTGTKHVGFEPGGSGIIGFTLGSAGTRGTVEAMQFRATNSVAIPTNYVAANFTPLAGYAKLVSSNGALFKVTQVSTNLISGE